MHDITCSGRVPRHFLSQWRSKCRCTGQPWQPHWRWGSYTFLKNTSSRASGPAWVPGHPINNLILVFFQCLFGRYSCFFGYSAAIATTGSAKMSHQPYCYTSAFPVQDRNTVVKVGTSHEIIIISGGKPGIYPVHSEWQEIMDTLKHYVLVRKLSSFSDMSKAWVLNLWSIDHFQGGPRKS